MFKALGQIIPDANQDRASLQSLSRGQDLPAVRDEARRAIIFDKVVDREIPDRVVCGRDVAGRPNELRRALTADERMAVAGRVVALKETLKPYERADRAIVEAEIAAMMSGFRAMRQHGDDALAMIEVTCAVLRDFPVWAIAKACRLIVTRQAYVDGRKLDERYAPNDSEIHAVVANEVRLFRNALNEATAILECQVRPEPLPRPTAEELQAKMVRPAAADVESKGGHARRVADDLAMRKASKDNGGWIGA